LLFSLGFALLGDSTLIRFLIASLLAASACQHEPSKPGAAPSGIAAFTRHSRFVDAKISPKGTYLAAISTEQGKRAMTIIDLKARKIASRSTPPSSRPAPSPGPTTSG
jgi:hypothetical protein